MARTMTFENGQPVACDEHPDCDCPEGKCKKSENS